MTNGRTDDKADKPLEVYKAEHVAFHHNKTVSNVCNSTGSASYCVVVVVDSDDVFLIRQISDVITRVN